MQKEHLLNRLFLLMQELFRTHPMPLWRTAELLRWAEEGSYLEVLAGDYLRRGEEAPASFEEAHEEAAQDIDEDEGPDDDPLGQVKDAGQELLNQVQDAIQQGGALLRQLFGNERSGNDDETRRDK